MNVEYVGATNNQKLTTKMLFVETFFMEPFFTNWALHPFTILFFVVILKAKIMSFTINCVIHFMTADFTVSLGVVRVYIQTKRKNLLQNSWYPYVSELYGWITSSASSNKWSTLIYNEVMDSQISMVSWVNCKGVYTVTRFYILFL